MVDKEHLLEDSILVVADRIVEDNQVVDFVVDNTEAAAAIGLVDLDRTQAASDTAGLVAAAVAQL